MSWVTDALKSSVGKKCVMGLTGLFLCVFLVVHLGGNLLLYVGAEKYDHYAHTLHSYPALLLVAEVILYAAFIVHIYLAFVTNRDNHAARGNPYAMKQTKRVDRTFNILGFTPDTTMFVTGAVVFGFLLIHLNDFAWGIIGAEQVAGKEPFDKAQTLMHEPLRAAIYAVAALFLGVHVSHGLQSACQSLGLNHPRYQVCLRRTSVVFAFIVTLGFGSFCLWGLSGPHDQPSTRGKEGVESGAPSVEAVQNGNASPESAPASPEESTQR